MTSSYVRNFTVSSGSSTFIRGDSKLHSFKQSKNLVFGGDSVRCTLPVVPTYRYSDEFPAGIASVSALTLEEAHPREGRSAEWSWSASASSAQQWLKQQLEVERFFSNLQPANLSRTSSSARLQKTPSTGSLETIESLAYGRLLNLPKPLSINGLTVPKAKRSTALRVAHPGKAGAHSEAAAAKAYPECEPFPCGKFEVPFEAVELGLADRAVIPIENSVGGSVHKNYDLLLRHRLNIVGEVQLPIRHCLLALPGKVKSDLRKVLSHPQALSQCEHNLSQLGVRAEAVNDTATAAQLVATHRCQDTGAIASSAAAILYGLDILDSDFQDYSGNTTRFWIVAREPLIPGTERKSKTSIVFALKNGCDDLFRALSVFALRNINLAKIESRPQGRSPLQSDRSSRCMKEKLFDCLFYIDFEASMGNWQAQNALKELQEVATFLRVLGSYPIDVPSSS